MAIEPDPAYTNSNQHSDTLNANTTHDTGLYDPAMQDNRIVVMYDTRAAAEAARESLVEQVASIDAQVVEETADHANAGVNSEGGNTGLLGAVKGLFAQDDEVHGVAEGVRHGQALLVVKPASGTREQIISLIEGTNPINFDAKLEQWRSAGWDNLEANRPAETSESGKPDSAKPT